jgi:hypothetical protein
MLLRNCHSSMRCAAKQDRVKCWRAEGACARPAVLHGRKRKKAPVWQQGQHALQTHAKCVSRLVQVEGRTSTAACAVALVARPAMPLARTGLVVSPIRPCQRAARVSTGGTHMTPEVVCVLFDIINTFTPKLGLRHILPLAYFPSKMRIKAATF